MSPAEPTNLDNTETEFARLAPPQGWTDDREQMNIHYYWQGRPGDLKYLLQTVYKVPNPEPLLTRDPTVGDILFLLQGKDNEDSKAKYYVWNSIESELHWIESPTSLKEIYQAIHEKNGYLGALEFVEIVSADEERDED